MAFGKQKLRKINLDNTNKSKPILNPLQSRKLQIYTGNLHSINYILLKNNSIDWIHTNHKLNDTSKSSFGNYVVGTMT